MRIREHILEKKKNLEGKLLIKTKENQSKKVALEHDIQMLSQVKEILQSE